MTNGHDTHIACDDWRLSRRTLLGRSGSVLPLPAELLEQMAASSDLTRGQFLARSGGLLALCGTLAGGTFTAQRALSAAAADNAERPDAPILVSLYLDGGNDGLNTLVPLAEPRYHRLRKRVGIDFEQTIPLRDAKEFGWHPALKGLARLYNEGKVAVLPSVDFANPDLSHFNSAEYWRKGIIGHVDDPTGWLGRALDVSGNKDNPFQGICVQSNLDPLLMSARAPVATIYDPAGIGLWIEGVHEEPIDLYRNLSTLKAESVALRAAREVTAQTVAVRERLRPLQDRKPWKPPMPYPDTYLGTALRNLARLLGAGFGTRIGSVAHNGGFDTHEDQLAHHTKLLEELDQALVAWQADLERRGLADRVLTLVWSEFGRRPMDNQSNGTDHGSGGLLLVVGNRAHGGIRSEFPGLAKLDALDNLKVTTEFRTVYASLLEDWLGVEAARVLPGNLPKRIGLVAPAARPS